jgi:hypothetical protein
MKVWRVIATDDNGRGYGAEYQDRWQAEEEYERLRKPGMLVTLAEFIDNRQTEIVRDTRFEIVERKP